MKIIITGTSRGIGLALARIALEAGHQVLAVSRTGSPALETLAARHASRLERVAVDLRDDGAARAIADAAGSHAVDVLVNNAGILRGTHRREDFLDSFLVNAIAPFEVTQALLPLLKKAASPRVVQITSQMGSIADNRSGGYHAYRASKAALNMINMCLARDEEWLTSIVVHPGWVQTDMGGAGATVPAAQSARGIWRILEGLGPADSGRFLDYRGEPLPW